MHEFLAIISILSIITFVFSIIMGIISLFDKFEDLAKPSAVAFLISVLVGLPSLFFLGTINSKNSSSLNSGDTAIVDSSSSFTEADYNEVNFDDWNHDTIEEDYKIKVTGTVIQNGSDDGGRFIRVNIEQEDDELFETNTILAIIPDSIYNEVIAKGDEIVLYGRNKGLTTYEAVFGQEVTVPYLTVDKYEVYY